MRQKAWIRPAVAGLAALVMLAGTASCAKKATEGADGGPKLAKAGSLTVCTQLPFEPFESKDASGKIVGLDVDYVGLVAKKLNLKLELLDVPFEGIKSGQDLKTGKCDLAAAGISISPERQRVMDFSTPYFNATQALLVLPDAPYTTLASLRGKRIGAQSGTVGLDYLNKNAKANGYTPVSYRDIAAQTQSLLTKQTDATVNDFPVLAQYVKKTPGKAKVAAQFDTGDKYGFAVAKGGNPKLLQTVNTVIAAAKKDGTEAAMLKKWMGAAAAS